MKKLFIVVAFILSAISLFPQDYPVESVNGVECYVYTVEKGEGLYRISKKFDVLQSEIYQVNSNIENGIEVGQTIYVPVKDSKKSIANKAKKIEHSVVAGQTLYSISKMYGVPQEAIIDANPSIEGDKVKKGDVLVIPVSQTKIGKSTKSAKQSDKDKQPLRKYVSYEVKKKKETLYSISKQFGITINELIEANPQAENGIKRGDVLRIPIVEENIPKATDVSHRHIVQPKETIYGVSHKYGLSQEQLLSANPQLADGLRIGDTLNVSGAFITPAPIKPHKTTIEKHSGKYRIVYLLPFSSAAEEVSGTSIDRFIDFYRGSLIALDDLKKQGYSFEVYAFDTQLGVEKVKDVLKNKMPSSVDLIIGPAYPAQVSLVADYAKEHKINQVVPFTSKIDNSDKFSLQYQFNPSTEELDAKIVERILYDNKKSSFVFVNFPYTDQKSYSLPESLKTELRHKSIKYAEYNAHDMTAQQLQQIINNKAVVVLSSCNTQDLDQFFARFSGYRCENSVFVLSEDMFDYVNANRYTIEAKEYLSYSLFNATPSEEYLNKYRDYFHVRNPRYVPNYDLLGYDLTSYFCSAICSGGSLSFNPNLLLLQSTFNFVKNNSVNHINVGCFIYRLQGKKLIVDKI